MFVNHRVVNLKASPGTVLSLFGYDILLAYGFHNDSEIVLKRKLSCVNVSEANKGN